MYILSIPEFKKRFISGSCPALLKILSDKRLIKLTLSIWGLLFLAEIVDDVFLFQIPVSRIFTIRTLAFAILFLLLSVICSLPLISLICAHRKWNPIRVIYLLFMLVLLALFHRLAQNILWYYAQPIVPGIGRNFDFYMNNAFSRIFRSVLQITAFGVIFHLIRSIKKNVSTKIQVEQEQRIVFRSSGSTIILPVQEIIYIEGKDYYSKVNCLSNSYLVRESLKSFEKKLPDKLFLRIHKSSIINTSFIKQINPNGKNDYSVYLTNDTILKLSRNYRDDFFAVMKNIE